MVDLTNFEKAPPEKRAAILNAGFSCFGQSGFQKTAISEIAAAAGVSKAALFHYFGTKKTLYLYLIHLSYQLILPGLGRGSDDFFESIKIGTRHKMAVADKHPGMFDFFFSLTREEDLAVVDEARRRHQPDLENGLALLFSQVDWNRLKPGVTPRQATNLVIWVSDGYVKTCTRDQDKDTIISGLDIYFDLIKRAIYKEEYQ